MGRHRAVTDPARVSPKVTAASLGLALAVVVVYVVESLTGLDVPEMVESAVGLVAVFGAGYLVPDPARGEG